MQGEERFGKRIYRNFAAEMEQFRRGKDSYILYEYENGWELGSLFEVWDVEERVCTVSPLGRMQIFSPKGVGKRYTNKPIPYDYISCNLQQNLGWTKKTIRIYI